jgi:hypothetical protein
MGRKFYLTLIDFANLIMNDILDLIKLWKMFLWIEYRFKFVIFPKYSNFGVGIAVQLCRRIPRMQVLTGLDPFSQTVGYFLRPPLSDEADKKIWAQSCSGNSLQWKNELDFFWMNEFRIIMV